MNVFFGVDNGDEANERASPHGYDCVGSLDYTQDEIDQHLGGLFKRYQEFTLNSSGRCGFTVSLAQIDNK